MTRKRDQIAKLWPKCDMGEARLPLCARAFSFFPYHFMLLGVMGLSGFVQAMGFRDVQGVALFLQF